MFAPPPTFNATGSGGIWMMIQNRAVLQVKGILSLDTLWFVLGMFIVFGMEAYVMGWKKSSGYRLLHPTLTTKTDIVWIICKLLGLQVFLFAGFSLGTTLITNRIAEKVVGFHLLEKPVLDGHPVLRVMLYLLWTDFLDYWIHRGRHGFGWWWEFHKAHHSAEEFNAITTARGHPLDGVFIVFSYVIPAAVLGGGMGTFAPVLIISAVHAGLTHSMLPWKWGWFGKYVIYPPTGHRIHHSAEIDHRDKNFGSIFPIWDHIFGTYYDYYNGGTLNAEVGVDDNYFNRKGFFYDLVEPCRRAIRSIRKLPLDGSSPVAAPVAETAPASARDDRAA